MTATDLDRWAADQAAYGSPDYVRGYRDGIDDAVQAAKDLGEVASGPSAFWTDHGHGAIIRILHTLDVGPAAVAVIAYLGGVAIWWYGGVDSALLARAAASTMRLRAAENLDLRRDRDEARAQYLTEHGVAW